MTKGKNSEILFPWHVKVQRCYYSTYCSYLLDSNSSQIIAQLHQWWNLIYNLHSQHDLGLFFLMVSTLYAAYEPEGNAFASESHNSKCFGVFKVTVVLLRFQMLKLSPQPHVPLMFGLLKTNSLDSLSST